MSFRVGHGYDVHRLVEGRKLILGGVEIPYKTGLLGHSDADVLLHAICDALLGAAAMRDIGYHFPDNDKSYENISSLILLQRTYDMIKEKGYEVVNVDATVIAQAPKLSPHINVMIKNVAKALQTDIENVNIKATTEEHMGFTGSGDGIAAHAVCIIQKID